MPPVEAKATRQDLRWKDAQKRGKIGKEGILKVRPLPHREQSKKKCVRVVRCIGLQGNTYLGEYSGLLPLTVQGRRRSDDEKDLGAQNQRNGGIAFSPILARRRGEGHRAYFFCVWNKTPPQRIHFWERKLPNVSIKTELPSGSVGEKLLFRYTSTGEMDGDDQKRKPRIKRGKLDVPTLEVQTNKGMVTVGDEPNFWEGKVELRRATKPVGEPRLRLPPEVTHVKDYGLPEANHNCENSRASERSDEHD
ncbi:hypothetical protein B0H14DRAFT_3150211 [Mycena olivaceomarginata]|nr:hypothetical protein B0H14DRAFT_3150211 [Mycena olivaceomarginata]